MVCIRSPHLLCRTHIVSVKGYTIFHESHLDVRENLARAKSKGESTEKVLLGMLVGSADLPPDEENAGLKSQYAVSWRKKWGQP